MIRTFKNKETQSIYEGDGLKKWQNIRQQIEKRLSILDAAVTLDDLRNLPSNRFEALIGNRQGQYSEPSMENLF